MCSPPMHFFDHPTQTTTYARPSDAPLGTGTEERQRSDKVAASSVGSTGDATPVADGEQPLPPGIESVFVFPGKANSDAKRI